VENNSKNNVELAEYIYLSAYGAMRNCVMYLGQSKDAESYKYGIYDNIKSFQHDDLPVLKKIAESIQCEFKIIFPEVIDIDLLNYGIAGFTPETTFAPTWNVEAIEEIFRSYANIANLLSILLRERNKFAQKIKIIESDNRGLNHQLSNAHAVVKRSKLSAQYSINEIDLKVLIDKNRFKGTGKVNLTKLGRDLGCGKDTAKKIIINHQLSRYALIN